MRLKHEELSRLLSEAEVRHITYSDPDTCFAAVAFNVPGDETSARGRYTSFYKKWWDFSNIFSDEMYSVQGAEDMLTLLENKNLV